MSDDKDMPPTGAEVERYAVNINVGARTMQRKVVIASDFDAHVTRLQAEVDAERQETAAYKHTAQKLLAERDALKAEVERLNKDNQAFIVECVTRGNANASLQAENAELSANLTKARESINDACEIITRLKTKGWSHGVDVEMDDYLEAHQSAPAAKDA